MPYQFQGTFNKQIWDFDPRTIPGCTVWLDAADASTIGLSGSSVTTWTDKSNIVASNLVASSGGNRPTYSLASANGLNTIAFDGTASQRFESATNITTNLPTGTASGTYFVVARISANGSLPQSILQYGSSNYGTATSRQFYFSNDTPSVPYIDNGVSASRCQAIGQYTPGTYTVLSSLQSQSPPGFSNTSFINGSSFSTNNSCFNTGTTNIGSAKFYIGAGMNTNGAATIGFPFTGNVAEILVYSTTLSTNERQQIEGYLAWKWGTQTRLPSTHPYSTIAYNYAPSQGPSWVGVKPFSMTFKPTDILSVSPSISGPCLFWYDGQDASTITISGGAITQWSDKSGRNNHITSFTGTSTYDSTTGLVTTGGTSYMQTPSLTVLNPTTRCQFIAFKVPAFSSSLTSAYLQHFTTTATINQANGGYMVRFARAGGSGQNHYIEQGIGTGPYFFYGPSSVTGPYTDAYMIQCCQRNGNSYTYTLNGNVSSSVTYPIATALSAGPSSAVYNSPFVTLSFASQTLFTPPAYLNQPIIVSGVTPAQYNGTYLVSGPSTSDTRQLSYLWGITGPSASGTGGTVFCPLAPHPLVGPIQIGKDNVPSSLSYGIGEMIMYDGALSDVERQRVESYLLWKWNNVRTSYPTAAGSTVPNLPTTHPYYKFPSPGTAIQPVSPLSFPNCFAWFDAADITTLANSGSASFTWKNKAEYTTARSAIGNVSFPTFGIGLNGLNMVNVPANVSGSLGRIELNPSGPGVLQPCPAFGSFNGQLTAFIVARAAASANSAGMTEYSGYKTLNMFWIPGTGPSGSVGLSTYGSVGFTNTVPSSIITNGFVMCAVSNGNGPNAVNLIVNGGTGPSGLQNSQNNSVNGAFGILDPMVSRDAPSTATDLGEIIMYATALTTLQRQYIEGYLAWKWGISGNLPTAHPYKSIAPLTVNWDPRFVGNITMWYDGADRTSMTINASSQITQLNDKSGNGYHLTTSIFGPTITSASNAVGYDIVFNGAQNLKNAAMSPGISTTQFTYFIVLVNKPTDTNSYGRFISASNISGDNTDVNGLCMTAWDLSTYPNRIFYALGGVGATTPVTANTYTIASFVWSSPTGNLFINGGSVSGVTSSNTLTFSKFGIGASPNADLSRLGNGSVVNEVLAFTSALSTTNRQLVEGYLAWKWGLQGSLAAGHPYLSASPKAPATFF